MKILINERQHRDLVKKRMSSCNIFSSSTGVPDYDDVLYNDKGKIVGEITTMSPDEYFDRCAQLQGTTVDKQYQLIEKPKLNNLADIIKSGEKIDLPFIDYSSGKQEGRHRAYIAKKRGCDSIS